MTFLESAGIGILLLATLLPLTVLLGGLAFVPRTKEFWSWQRAREVLAKDGKILLVLLALVPVFVLQATLDPIAAAWLGRDFTPFFEDFDGGIHKTIQAATPGFVVTALAVVYLLGFPVLLYLAPILSAWLGDSRTARRSLAAFVGCYIVALPFYFFFPVRETWTTGAAENLVLIAPHTETILYAFNDVTNAFPSEHTAMAVAVAWFAWQGPSRGFAWFGLVNAILIPISTVVLGIHWTLDVVAGFAAAALVIVAVDRLVPR